MRKNVVTKVGLFILCTMLLLLLPGCTGSGSTDAGDPSGKSAQSEDASGKEKKKSQKEESSTKEGKNPLSGLFKKSEKPQDPEEDLPEDLEEDLEEEATTGAKGKEKPGGKKEYWSGHGLPEVKVKPWNKKMADLDAVYPLEEPSDFLFESTQEYLLGPLSFISITPEMARLGRNEIFARHGYVFKNADLQSYFDHRPWYKKNPSYKGDLNKIENANVFFLQSFEKYMADDPGYDLPFSDDISPTAVFYPINQIIPMDLDGDGQEEKICLYIQENESDFTIHSALKVNDEVAPLDLVTPVNVLAFVDVDTKDDFLEIFIGDHGPSDDESTLIFRYQDGKLIRLGELPGILGGSSAWGLHADGKGLLKAWQRLDFFMSWHVPYRYYLKNGAITSPDSSRDIGVFAPLVLKDQLQLYPDKSFRKKPITLAAGTPVVLIETDQKQWIRLMAPGEKSGWFSDQLGINQSGKDASDIFDHLMFYD